MARKSIYQRLEKKIAGSERGGVESRWLYGREILADPRKMTASGKSLRHGAIEALIADAAAAGQLLSEQEIQRRLRCARAYKSINEIRLAMTDSKTWYDLIQAGFPAVEVDVLDVEPDDLETIGEDDPFQATLFEIPGFKPILKIRGQKVALADATVREAVDYRDMCHEMHANFGRTVEQVDASVETMLAGAAGDLDANAVEAWRRATEAVGG